MTGLPAVDELLARLDVGLRAELSRAVRAQPLLIGIMTGGVWVARRLHEALSLTEPLGELNIHFYRDDFTRVGLHPRVQPSALPCAVDDRHVVLVDDVLYTGRTIRAALNEIFDYGRPASVTLAVLVDRGGRELPVQADVVGLCLDLPADESVKLSGPEPLALQVRGEAADAPVDRVVEQVDAQGSLRHFLSTEGLGRDMLTRILDTAESFAAVGERAVKKVPLLRGRTVVNLFYEPSTRTRTTFELAAKRLSADVLNINVSASSTTKGESLLDTLRNLEAMHVDMFVVRHGESGAAHFVARHAAPHVSVINAGDGRHAHPTQALLDCFTIRRHKGAFEPLTVAVVGDVAHSRVARSLIHALVTLGVREVRAVAPRTLLPPCVDELGARVFHDMGGGLADADVVVMLRLQRERMQGALLPSMREYFHFFGLTAERLARARPDAIVMHPGPLNRGVEITSEVADGSRSVILRQVTYGIAVRMAVMSLALGSRHAEEREES